MLEMSVFGAGVGVAALKGCLKEREMRYREG